MKEVSCRSQQVQTPIVYRHALVVWTNNLKKSIVVLVVIVVEFFLFFESKHLLLSPLHFLLLFTMQENAIIKKRRYLYYQLATLSVGTFGIVFVSKPFPLYFILLYCTTKPTIPVLLHTTISIQIYGTNNNYTYYYYHHINSR